MLEYYQPKMLYLVDVMIFPFQFNSELISDCGAWALAGQGAREREKEKERDREREQEKTRGREGEI